MLVFEQILDAAYQRLLATGFAGGILEKHRDPPTEDDDLPLATITYDTDVGEPHGDARTGTTRFDHKLTLVIDVLDTGASGAAVMAKLAAFGQHAMQALCVDPWSWAPSDVVEGIGGARQLTDRSPRGAAIVYRRQIQIDVLYPSQWDPATDALPDLTTIGVGTGIGATEADGEVPAEPGIGVEIDVPTDD